MAERQPQIAPCGLPHLPPRAKPRLDHHGFREQGSKVAEERVKKLSAKIKSLRETEESLKEETETLSAKASKDLNEAERMKRDLDGMINANDGDERILNRVTNEIRKTRMALNAILAKHEKHERTKFQAVERGNQKEKRKMQLRRKKLATDRGNMKTELQNLEEVRLAQSTSSSCSDEDEVDKSNTGSDGMRDKTRERDETDDDLGTSQKTAAGEGKGETNQKALSETNDMEGRFNEQPTLDQGSSASPESQKTGQQKVRKPIDALEERVNRRRMRTLNDYKISDLRKKIESYEQRILTLDDKIQRAAEWSKTLKKEKEEEEALQSEEELENEEAHKRKIRDEEERERKELDDGDKREKKLQSLRQRLVDGSGGTRNVKSIFNNRFRQTHFGYWDSFRDYRDYRDFMLYPPQYRRKREVGWMESSGSGSSDDEDDELDEDDTRATAERRELFGRLEMFIMDAQKLERHIQTLQLHLLKLKGVVHLKEILEKEKWLEDQWLEQLKGPKTSDNLQDDELDVRRHGHHFKGMPVANEVYTSLKANEFRVLVLRPAPEPYYPLICSLETWPIHTSDDTASLGNTLNEYAALSYFWGSETCNGRIYLLPAEEAPGSDDASEWGSAARSATRIRIRNNLFRALLRLRRHGPGAQPVALWVDFMCINQADAKEKTDQLGRMVNIYRNARNVCIWLGESDSKGRSDEAMDFIKTIMDFAVLDRHAHDKRQAKKWHALGELMRDRWFSRRWVVQEIALSRDATVHCGAEIVRWSDFADAASLLVSNQDTIKSLFDFSEWREGRNTLGDVDSFGASILLEATNKLFRRKANGDIKWPLKTIESLVTSLQTFDAGDPRDLIYSVVSIAKDTPRNLWPTDPDHELDPDLRLEVDYSRSAAVVYKDFTKFCIQSSGSLDIICRPWAMPLKGDVHIPSWIPLLSRSEFGVPEEVYSGRKNGEGLVGRAGSPNYQASGKKRCEVKFMPGRGAQDDLIRKSGPEQSHASQMHDNDLDLASAMERQDDILVAHGFRLATISEVTPRNTGGVILRESLEKGGWKGFKRDTDSVPDPIWRTLVADRDEHGQVPPSWYQRACLRCLEIADTFNNGDLNVGELLQGHSEMLRKYLMRMRNVTWNRRFFKAVPHEADLKAIAEQSGGDESEDRSPDVEHRDDELTAPLLSQSRDVANSQKIDDDDQEQGQTLVDAGGETVRDGERRDQLEKEQVEQKIGVEGLVNAEQEVEEEKQKQEDGSFHTKAEDENKGNGDKKDGSKKDGKKEIERTGEEEADKEVRVRAEGDKEGSQIGAEDEEGEKETRNEEKSEGDEGVGEREAEGEEESEADVESKGESESEKASDSESENGSGSENRSEVGNAGADQATLFGLCPPETDETDFICILHGCSVPVVLREVKGGYMRLLGEAYVHGKMDGEAAEDFADNDARKEEEFHIK